MPALLTQRSAAPAIFYFSREADRLSANSTSQVTAAVLVQSQTKAPPTGTGQREPDAPMQQTVRQSLTVQGPGLDQSRACVRLIIAGPHPGILCNELTSHFS
jgi:hypothetical protein